jgi:uncharacterized protein
MNFSQAVGWARRKRVCDMLEIRHFAAKTSRLRRQPVMTWWTLLLGFGVGVISGVVGIGGGILLVPALVWFYGMSQHRAQGTSLAALLAPVGALAFWSYYRDGNADLKIGLLLALGFAVGGYFGGVGAQHVPEIWLRRVFAVTLVAVGVRMFWSK